MIHCRCLRSMNIAAWCVSIRQQAATNRKVHQVRPHLPVMWFSLALTSTLKRFDGCDKSLTRYTAHSVPVPSSSSNSFFSFLDRFSAGVSLRDRLRSSCACCRSTICFFTSASIAVGSAVASCPSTRIMLDSRTLGLGGSRRPCLLWNQQSCSVRNIRGLEQTIEQYKEDVRMQLGSPLT